jgi:hypothetical protein
MTRYLLLFDRYGLVFLGRPLWREAGSVFICCWPSPGLYFSGLSTLALVTIFYCLRFETPLFLASYGSQGHGWGIRPRLHTELVHCSNYPSYSISAWNTQKTPFLCYCIQLLLGKHARFRNRYLVTAVVYLLTSRSLSSNGSTCHSIYKLCIKYCVCFLLCLSYSSTLKFHMI